MQSSTVEFGISRAEEERNQGRKQKKLAKRDHNRVWKDFGRKEWSGEEANNHFSAYYREQLAHDIPTAGEFQDFTAALSRPLPVTLRLSSARKPAVAAALRMRMHSEFQFKGKFVQVNGEVLQKVLQPLSWYPDAWQINTHPQGLSRTEALAPLHEVVVREVDMGHMVRQEAASMIPALLCDVQPDSTVLDMCAAPGSKTEQLLAMMSGAARDAGTLVTGMVVGNDCDSRRLCTLSRRYGHTRHPALVLTAARGEDLMSHIVGEHVDDVTFNPPSSVGTFDRVLCDVPCTGDGTFRKCPHLWRLWRARRAVELHVIQLQIVTAGAALLKPGGRIVYSTCSQNPMEDEAVVAALLRRGGGALTLVDIHAPGVLPGLKRRKGIHEWRSDAEVMVLGVGEDDEEATLARMRANLAVLSGEAQAAEEADGKKGGKGGKKGDAGKKQPKHAHAASGPAAAMAVALAAAGSKKMEENAPKKVGDYVRPPGLSAPSVEPLLLPPSAAQPTAEERQWMHLERCMRILPQDNDTGGFFVAVIEKALVSPAEKAGGGEKGKKGKKDKKDKKAVSKRDTSASRTALVDLGYLPAPALHSKPLATKKKKQQHNKKQRGAEHADEEDEEDDEEEEDGEEQEPVPSACGHTYTTLTPEYLEEVRKVVADDEMVGRGGLGVEDQGGEWDGEEEGKALLLLREYGGWPAEEKKADDAASSSNGGLHKAADQQILNREKAKDKGKQGGAKRRAREERARTLAALESNGQCSVVACTPAVHEALALWGRRLIGGGGGEAEAEARLQGQQPVIVQAGAGIGAFQKATDHFDGSEPQLPPIRLDADNAWAVLPHSDPERVVSLSAVDLSMLMMLLQAHKGKHVKWSLLCSRPEPAASGSDGDDSDSSEGGGGGGGPVGISDAGLEALYYASCAAHKSAEGSMRGACFAVRLDAGARPAAAARAAAEAADVAADAAADAGEVETRRMLTAPRGAAAGKAGAGSKRPFPGGGGDAGGGKAAQQGAGMSAAALKRAKKKQKKQGGGEQPKLEEEQQGGQKQDKLQQAAQAEAEGEQERAEERRETRQRGQAAAAAWAEVQADVVVVLQMHPQWDAPASDDEDEDAGAEEEFSFRSLTSEDRLDSYAEAIEALFFR